MSQSTKLHTTLTRPVIHAGDTPTDTFPWGTITWIDSAAITGSETLTIGIVQIEAGQQNPRHCHPNCDEALLLLEGELVHWIGEEEYLLRPGSLVHIPTGAPHQARNPGATPARMMVSYNTGRREMVLS